MKRIIKILSVAGGLLLTASLANAQTFVRMVSGPAGGSWYPLGAKIMQVMQKEVGGIATSNGPGGGVGNVRHVDSGSAELGWTFGFTAYNGYAGVGKFKKKHPNVRYFTTLYPGVIQTAVPASSSIKSYADLKNKRLSPGKVIFSGNVIFERLIKLYGFTYDSVKAAGGIIERVGFKDSVALMKDGHIDSYTALTDAPNASFIALDFQPGIRLLPIEPEIAKKFLKQNPGFFPYTIKAGTYKHITHDVHTLASATVLIINKNVSNELAYKLVKVFWQNHDALAQVNKSWNHVRLADALRGAAIPVHPGVMKYYKEVGVAK